MTVNRERQKIWRERDVIDINYDTLDQAIKTLQGFRDEYGGDARIEKRDYPYEDREYLAVMVQEDETDREMRRRIQQEEQQEARQVERDRQEYERLRAKFGG